MEGYAYLVFGQPYVMTDAGADGNWLTADTTTYSTSAIGNPYLFTGRRWDGAAQLYYYRFRDYAPLIGRFCQPDPLGYIDGMNLYAYVNNNPLNWTDPWGLSFWSWLGNTALGSVSGAATGAITGLMIGGPAGAAAGAIAGAIAGGIVAGVNDAASQIGGNGSISVSGAVLAGGLSGFAGGAGAAGGVFAGTIASGIAGGASAGIASDGDIGAIAVGALAGGGFGAAGGLAGAAGDNLAAGVISAAAEAIGNAIGSAASGCPPK